MMRPGRSRLSLVRGLYGASLGAMIGAVVPAAMVLGAAACWWWASGSSESDRAYDRYAVLPDIPALVVFGSTVFACAGWATFAPLGAHRFARTLAIIFAVTVPFWCVVGWVVNAMELTPRRLKGVDHPTLYPSEMAAGFVILVIPAVVATILTEVRGHNAAKSKTSES